MTDFWAKFLQELILGAIVILVPPLVVWIVAKIKLAFVELKAKKPELAAILEAGAKLVVNAAEQANIAGLIENKKAYALKALQDYLNAQGWGGLNVSVLEAAIEAAVKEAAFPHETPLPEPE